VIFPPRPGSGTAVFDICTGLQQQAYVRVPPYRRRNSFHLLTLQYLLEASLIRPQTSPDVDDRRAGVYSQASGGRSLRGGLTSATFL
jgi:hypothetical protein